MRLYQEGFELDSAVTTGFDSSTKLLPIAQWISDFFSSVVPTTVTPHTNPNGDGGSISLGIGGFTNGNRFFSPQLPVDLKYGWIGFAIKVPDIGTSRFGISVINDGFSNIAKQVDVTVEFTGIVSLRVGGTTVATGTTIFNSGWHWVALEYFCDDTLGFMNLYVDDVQEITFNSSDTRGDATYDFWNEVQIELGVNSQLDDIVINTATVSYVGGTGLPTVGNVVTGGTSGATAVITSFAESISGVGYLTLEPNPGDIVGPSGFTLTEGLSDGAGWTSTSAQVDMGADGLDKNSGKPLETFLLLLRTTSTTSAGLTGQDADQIDNHLNVDDNPFGSDALTYNEGAASGLEDVYGMESIPFSPESIDAVEIIVYASRAGSIPGVKLGVNPGSGTTYGENKAVGSGGTFAKGSQIFDVNPDTSIAWTEGNVNSSDIAVKLS